MDLNGFLFFVAVLLFGLFMTYLNKQAQYNRFLKTITYILVMFDIGALFAFLLINVIY